LRPNNRATTFRRTSRFCIWTSLVHICIQGVFEIRAQILITSYWLHVELGKKYLKNCVRFIKYDIQGVFLKCAEILPTRLFDNVED
jgi:hypothetical protein